MVSSTVVPAAVRDSIVSHIEIRARAGPDPWWARRGTARAGCRPARRRGPAAGACRPSRSWRAASPPPPGRSARAARPRGRARRRLRMWYSRPTISRFSNPVRFSSTAAYWPASPIFARSAAASRTTSWPAMRACPASGFSSVARIRTAVVLPAPLGPSRPRTLPCRAAKSTPHRARTEPYDFSSPSTKIASSVMWPDARGLGRRLSIRFGTPSADAGPHGLRRAPHRRPAGARRVLLARPPRARRGGAGPRRRACSGCTRWRWRTRASSASGRRSTSTRPRPRRLLHRRSSPTATTRRPPDRGPRLRLRRLRRHRPPRARARARRLHGTLAAEDADAEDYLVYRIFDTLTDAWYPVIAAIESRIDALEAEVLAARRGASSSRAIYRLRQEVRELQRLVLDQRDHFRPAAEAIRASPGLQPRGARVPARRRRPPRPDRRRAPAPVRRPRCARPAPTSTPTPTG